MKTFLKDQLRFILFFHSQCLLIILVAQLTAMKANTVFSAGTIFYMFLLPTWFLVIFLVVGYFKLRPFTKTFLFYIPFIVAIVNPSVAFKALQNMLSSSVLLHSYANLH